MRSKLQLVLDASVEIVEKRGHRSLLSHRSDNPKPVFLSLDIGSSKSEHMHFPFLFFSFSVEGKGVKASGAGIF